MAPKGVQYTLSWWSKSINSTKTHGAQKYFEPLFEDLCAEAHNPLLFKQGKGRTVENVWAFA